MPKVFRYQFPAKYRGVRGRIRLLFDPPPPNPVPPEGSHEVPTFITRKIPVVTIGGSETYLEAGFSVTWVGKPPPEGHALRLTKEELDEAFEAWDQEVWTPALADSFAGYDLVWIECLQHPIAQLCFWRINRSSPEPTLESDVVFDRTIKAINEQEQRLRWRHKETVIALAYMNLNKDEEMWERNFQQLLPAQFKRLDALNLEELWLPHAKSLEWVRRLQKLVDSYAEEIATQEGSLMRIQEIRRRPVPRRSEEIQTRVTLEHLNESMEIS